MLDDNARKVLKYFIKSKSNQDWSTIAQSIKLDKDMNQSINLIHIALNDLLETKCIAQVSSYNNNCVYKLTSYGKMYFKSQKSETFHKYWFPIITSTLAFLLSLLADLLLK